MNSYSLSPGSPPATNQSGWNAFLELIDNHPTIPPKAKPYYARWVAQWMKVEGGGTSAKATHGFFDSLGRRPHLKDWQFRQAVEAVRLWATRIARHPWASTFDWNGLADQAADLLPDHQTLLRESTAAPPSSYPPPDSVDP